MSVTEQENRDVVDHPAHYTAGRIEVADAKCPLCGVLLKATPAGLVCGGCGRYSRSIAVPK